MAKKRSAGSGDRRPGRPRDGERHPVEKAGPAITGFRDAWAWVVILCATLVAYWPALQGSLLWDDNCHLTRPDLRSWHGLWRIWFDLGATQQYYPLLHSAFWIEHRIWGDAVLGYHLTNVALHAASACLVVLIVRRLSLAGRVAGGLRFCAAPGVRGSGGVDLGAEEHALGGLLPGRGARLPAFRPDAPEVALLPGAGAVCAGVAE